MKFLNLKTNGLGFLLKKVLDPYLASCCMFVTSMKKIDTYSVKQMAKLAGISVRTLHLYDEIGLLKPSYRSDANYRFYCEKELLRLQQVLLYKELDFPLQEIIEILDNPDFELLPALQNHKKNLELKNQRISTMIHTINQTINYLKKGGNMLKPEDLYEGLPKETMENYRKESIEIYGKDAIEQSEKYLLKMSKEELNILKNEQQENARKLFELRNENYESEKVQELVAEHYTIIRKFWGTFHSKNNQAEAYSGLGDLYVNDERFTMMDGKPQLEFAEFLQKAIKYFAEKI